HQHALLQRQTRAGSRAPRRRHPPGDRDAAEDGGSAMMASTMTMNQVLDRRRTSWSMTASMVIHSILLLLLVTVKAQETKLPDITEILMVEPGDLAAPAAPAPAAPSASTTPGLARSNADEERFTRSLNRAPLEPAPQSTSAIEDRIASRLASLQQHEPLTVAGTGAAGVPSAAW